MRLKKITTLIMLCSSLIIVSAQQNDIFLADPTILLDNGTYYLYGTEKKPQKGFPVYISKNLKVWDIPTIAKDGYALLRDNKTYGTQGFWAPQVFKHGGKYFMAYTANENLAIAESNSPTGPFTQKIVKPIDEKSRKIDPFVFFDDNGKAYLYHVRLNKGNSIWVAEMNTDLSVIKDSTLKQCIYPTQPWENTWPDKAPPIAEGPTVIKHKGIYYLFYSANDFRNIDYSVGYATSRSPFGPWTKFSRNPIISRENTGFNGSGHGDVLFDKGGKMYYVFHTHYNDSTVNNRRTLIVRMKFTKSKTTGIDEITVCKTKIICPQLSDK